MAFQTFTAEVTFTGTTATVDDWCNARGVITGCSVVHSGTGFSMTITDEYGMDVLNGLGTVGASGLHLYAEDIGGNPVRGKLTINISSATSTETATIALDVRT